ncbi:MAG: NAD+ synthase [Thermoplasmata archaeon]|nr:NAD+ synthase [Thermoplasmata archaeon]
MNLVPRTPAHAESTIHQFLRSHVAGAGASGVVLGLSGGIDSALAARLARDALGAKAVTAVLLPDAAQAEGLTRETREYARSLEVECVEVPIAPVEAAVLAAIGSGLDRESVGNIKARIRMLLLYTIGRRGHRLVLGTGNKSELLLGYFTKYGDGGADLLPIGDLYKTEVRALAEALGLPGAIRARPPTAGLWEGQTDEGELGLPYAELDRVLRGLEELRSEEEIASATGIDPGEVRRIAARVAHNRHKRRMPPIPKLSLRTIGIDWRE